MDIERLNNLKLQQYNMMAYSQVRNDFVKLIDAEIARQSVTSEDVQMAIDQVEGTRRKAQKELDSLIETKSRYDHQIEIGDPWNWKWEESWHPLAVEGHKQTIKNANLAITALQAYQPWIPVSERMPTEEDADKKGFVLTYDKLEAQEPFPWDRIEEWNATKDNKITHWKPLPEPPKGE